MKKNNVYKHVKYRDNMTYIVTHYISFFVRGLSMTYSDIEIRSENNVEEMKEEEKHEEKEGLKVVEVKGNIIRLSNGTEIEVLTDKEIAKQDVVRQLQAISRYAQFRLQGYKYRIEIDPHAKNPKLYIEVILD